MTFNLKRYRLYLGEENNIRHLTPPDNTMRTKFTMTRDNYLSNFLAQGYKKVISLKGTDLYMKTVEGSSASFCAIGFSGKKAKYDFYIAFRTADRRAEYVAGWENRIKSWNDMKAASKAKRMMPSSLKVGDILYTSWGYDQTNVDFFQVVNIPSKCFVDLRKLKQEYTYKDGNSSMSAYTSGVKDAFSGSDILKRKVDSRDSVKIGQCETAWVWDGNPKYVSWYA